MREKLIFATGNPNKIKEAKQILGDYMEVISMKEIGCEEDLPETQNTLEGNALQKAKYLQEHYQVNCFSEDTGLEIKALNNEPGVMTARYAGAERDADANMSLVLRNLDGQKNRKAQFRTVIALILNDKEYLFEGIVEGTIANEKRGSKGFGYDPIFIPKGFDKTFAELDAKQKNKISHRARAIQKFSLFLKRLK